MKTYRYFRYFARRVEQQKHHGCSSYSPSHHSVTRLSVVSMLSTIPSSQTEKKKSKNKNNSSEKETLSTSTAIAEDSSGGVGSNVLMNNEESKPNVEKRQRLRDVKIADVLKAKHTLRWVAPTISQESTIQEAISVAIERGLSGMMVVDREEKLERSREKGKVVGMTTSRDLLRVMHKDFRDGKDPQEVMDTRVKSFMTPISQVIYARPDETIGMCRTIMAKLGIKCLPVLSMGRVEGIITAKDISEFGLDSRDRGGKKNYLENISERVGLSDKTHMAEPPTYYQYDIATKQNPLFVNAGLAELPHPFKSQSSCEMNHKDYGYNNSFEKQFATDPDLSEDAHFIRELKFPGENEILYMGIADGVGSWREYGVDPRDFSHKLMEECDNVLLQAIEDSTSSQLGHQIGRVISPQEVLAKAYERVKEENVIGSSTACVAYFDGNSHQLHFTNLGDCGIIVLRHIDSDVAGALKRNRTTPRSERKSDLRVAFVSQQQLWSFNHPYQLGWTGEEPKNGETSFKSAADFCSTSIHIRRGDIIVMASDGLYDNVDIDEISQITLDWETKHSFIRGNDLKAREKRWGMGNSMSDLSFEKIPALADTLCKRARDLSLDNTVDSPFAILAKENDIMWSGGMPDDCTVIALHVVGRSHDDKFDQTNN